MAFDGEGPLEKLGPPPSAWMFRLESIGLDARLCSSFRRPSATRPNARKRGRSAGGGSPGFLAQAETIEQLSPMAKLTLSVGAGLYEEDALPGSLGSLCCISFLVDLIGLTSRWAYPIAIVIAAVGVRGAYHQDQSAPKFLFRTLAGIYLGTVYVMRGFGIVVGTHAMFDVLTFLIQ